MGAHVVLPFRQRVRRRDEINRHFAAWEPAANAGDDWVRRARTTLEGLGPVFGAFAAYMGSRIDLLCAMDCRELARADRRGRAASLAVVGTAIGSQDVTVDAVPVAVSTATQVHRAFLPDGTVVYVHVHTASFDESGEDLESLALAEPVFAAHVGKPALVSAIADFCVRLQDDGDLLGRAGLLEDGARDVDRGAPMLLPRPVPALCSARALVTAAPETERRHPFEQDPWSGQRSDESAIKVWVHQALFGSVCPLFAPDERITMSGDRLVGASLVRVPKAAQDRLLSYLFAVTADCADRAWDALHGELVPTAQAPPADHVLREFRRLVPFRDDRFTESGSPVADQSFLQWRTASRHGWLPGPRLAPFYQALFGVLCAAPPRNGGDEIADAIACLRVPSDVRRLAGWMAEADVMSALERQMALMIELPQKIDKLLTVAADGAVRVQLVTADAATVARGNRIATAVALLLLAAALVVLAGAWPAVRQLWASEPGRSAALLVAGAVLVWTVGRLR